MLYCSVFFVAQNQWFTKSDLTTPRYTQCKRLMIIPITKWNGGCKANIGIPLMPKIFRGYEIIEDNTILHFLLTGFPRAIACSKHHTIESCVNGGCIFKWQNSVRPTAAPEPSQVLHPK